MTDSEELNTLIDERCKKILSKTKYLIQLSATVVSYDSGTGIAVVNFASDTATTKTNVSIYNYSGQLLTVGDTVLVFIQNGSNQSTGYILADRNNVSV